MKMNAENMHTYLVQLDHGRYQTITEVEGETFDMAVRCAFEIEGQGRVMSVLQTDCADSYEVPLRDCSPGCKHEGSSCTMLSTMTH